MTWTRRLMVSALAVVVAAGCGGDADDDTDGASTTTAAVLDDTASAGTDEETDDAATQVHPLVVAHRGASGLAPELTIAAVELAVELDADVVEVDVQLTADGEVVVLHDADLDRTARGPAEDCTGPVRERTLAQVQGCDAGSWFSEENPDLADPSFADEHVPSLAEVLAAGGDEARWLIESKKVVDDDGALERAVAEVLDETGFAAGTPAAARVVFQSFDRGSVQHMAAIRPDLTLWSLTPVALDDAALDEVAEHVTGIGISWTAVDEELLASAHERCLTVVPYTVNDPDEMSRLLDLGVDGIISDRPDLLVPLAAEHDWVPPCG